MEKQHLQNWDLIEAAIKPSLLRFSTAGSVDDGKSTLIGRLLHDTDNIYEDHIDQLKRKSEKYEQNGGLALALLTDGLKAELEQGITIDVAYRYFSTSKRWFIIADTPGHEQYTRNMATGASTADLTIILVDATKGVLTQTKRHAFIAALLGVPRLLITVNKMDLVAFEQSRFDEIRDDFSEFAAKIGIRELRFIPIVALHGDNVVEASQRMPWYHGETVMEYLENVYIAGDVNHVDFRFPVQYVLRPNQSYRGYAGQISSGQIRVGEEVLVLPSMRRSKVKSINVDARDERFRNLEAAFAPMSIALTLEDEIDISRGDMLVRPLNMPPIKSEFEALVIWMADQELDLKKRYIVMHTARQSNVFVTSIIYKIDVNTLHRCAALTLKTNEVARVAFAATQPLFLDSYRNNRATGNFILIDADTFHTVAAGMVIDRLPIEFGESEKAETELTLGPSNLHPEIGLVSRQERENRFGKALTVWLTGLSGSGKSTLAKALERRLFEQGLNVYRLDGDNLRTGLNSDLGFSSRERSENIRRVAEVAKLFNDAGLSVICSFISPLEDDRAKAREVIGPKNFIEVYLSTSLEVCEMRDPHKLYQKARAGEIKDFTGISSPYQAPSAADLNIDTAKCGLEDCVRRVLDCLMQRKNDA